MAEDDRPPPAIEVGGSARAKRVRFEKTPDTHVRYRGQFSAEEVHERENLPERVEAETDYTDVRVRWHTSVRITEEDEPEG